MESAEKRKTILILGAGPAGLTAAYELLKTDKQYKIILVEKNSAVGGMCRSVKYKDNYMDVGGHRYFTKFEKVKDWWLQFLPLQTFPSKDDVILNRDLDFSEKNDINNPEKKDAIMLKRNRLSRIYYLRRFFDYPVKLNFATIIGLGIWRMVKIFFSYVHAKICPRKPEKTAEDFMINSFGRVLYRTFFENYTEKLWGVKCCEISSSWCRERIKGIRFWETVWALLKSPFVRKDIVKDEYLYPKFGPGQIWDEVAAQIIAKGGEIKTNARVSGINVEQNEVKSVKVLCDGKEETLYADRIISSLPIKDLVDMMNGVDEDVKKIADGLVYRNFRAAGILLNKLKLKNKTKIPTINEILPDTWVYIQEEDVKMGRMQIYNNWSPYLVGDDKKVWIAFEYFASDTDDIWTMPAEDFEKLAINEGVKIGMIEKEDVIDITSEKLEKAYPAYFGTFGQFYILKEYIDKIKNLYLIGRAGMHKYINIDHAVLSGMEAAKNISENMQDKENIWNIELTKELD